MCTYTDLYKNSLCNQAKAHKSVAFLTGLCLNI